MKDPSAQQLDDELERAIARTSHPRRPQLTHLNADTSWLLQLPQPAGSPDGRVFFNVVLDPWFAGPQSDVASWFSTQYHAIQSSVQSVAELEAALRRAEELARPAPPRAERTGSTEASGTYVDAIAVSHEFTDHCHQGTLLEFAPGVPVFATDKAAGLIRSWAHFRTVITMPAFSPSTADWKKTSIPPLPDFLGISRVVSKGDAFYYNSAVMLAFNVKPEKDSSAEAVFYSPHGIKAHDLKHIPHAQPPIRSLAMLHGLHDIGVRMSMQLNLGAHNGLQAVRACGAKYWIGTHDEVKKGSGIVSPLLRRKQWTAQEALDEERRLAKGDDGALVTKLAAEDVRYLEMASGESLILE